MSFWTDYYMPVTIAPNFHAATMHLAVSGLTVYKKRTPEQERNILDRWAARLEKRALREAVDACTARTQSGGRL